MDGQAGRVPIASEKGCDKKWQKVTKSVKKWQKSVKKVTTEKKIQSLWVSMRRCKCFPELRAVQRSDEIWDQFSNQRQDLVWKWWKTLQTMWKKKHWKPCELLKWLLSLLPDCSLILTIAASPEGFVLWVGKVVCISFYLTWASTPYFEVGSYHLARCTLEHQSHNHHKLSHMSSLASSVFFEGVNILFMIQCGIFPLFWWIAEYQMSIQSRCKKM